MKDILRNEILNSLKELDYPKIDFKIDYPKIPEHGDYTANVALVLAKLLKLNPREIAKIITDKLIDNKSLFSKIEIAGAGFINFFLNDSIYKENLTNILNGKNHYGKSDTYLGKKANLEWVSANPTGPLHAGHGRQVCLGKAVSNLLEWVGYDVEREYYYNDAGNQMNNLAKSVYARYMQIFDDTFPFPDDGYNGDYILEIAKDIFDKENDKLKNSEDLRYFKNFAEKSNFSKIKNTLSKFGIQHSIFFNESELYSNGDIQNLLDIFKEKNLSRVENDAIWLKMDSEKFDKDKVIVKATGEPTYRLPDMAYHINKIKRGYDLIIDIFGSDHNDTYKEVLYGINCAGYPVDNIKVIIHQMVTFKLGNTSVKMSKRSDNVYYLDDLINDVGIDATQFFFVMRAANTHLDFDIELAKEQSDKNPVYYLQYAFARICGIFRNANEHFPDYNNKEINYSLIKTSEEMNLLKILLKFPEEVKSAALQFEPHKIINYLNDVAEAFHVFYHNNRVINLEDKETSISRLKICEAVRIVLKNGFDIIGINAPDKM